jgi:hypothetical protein
MRKQNLPVLTLFISLLLYACGGAFASVKISTCTDAAPSIRDVEVKDKAPGKVKEYSSKTFDMASKDMKNAGCVDYHRGGVHGGTISGPLPYSGPVHHSGGAHGGHTTAHHGMKPHHRPKHPSTAGLDRDSKEAAPPILIATPAPAPPPPPKPKSMTDILKENRPRIGAAMVGGMLGFFLIGGPAGLLIGAVAMLGLYMLSDL